MLTRTVFQRNRILPNESCASVYGGKTVSGNDMKTWTKGHVLRKFNKTDCAYELHCENNKDFLIIEWKSGDYHYVGHKPGYYVFTGEKRN